MGIRSGSGTRRGLRSFVLALSALGLAACSEDNILPHETSSSVATFPDYQQIETAYAAVIPGTTTAADLPKLGFDVKSAPNIEILSSVDIAARLPETTKVSGQIPIKVQMCIDAQDHCIAYLFRPQHIERHHVGNAILDLGGFESKTVKSGWSAEVVLLLQDDIVVYKHMVGHPRVEERQHSVQPLGPLQDLGDSISGKHSGED